MSSTKIDTRKEKILAKNYPKPSKTPETTLQEHAKLTKRGVFATKNGRRMQQSLGVYKSCRETRSTRRNPTKTLFS
jgi:hypothetical protein